MYHSALNGFNEYNKKAKKYKSENINAFIFNIEIDTIPVEFYSADFIYGELPYRSGYETFNKRAGVAGFGYDVFILKILNIILILKKPFFIVGAKNIKPLNIFYVKEIENSIHKCKTYLYSDKLMSVKNTEQLLTVLYKRYNTGLDFMCGYGILGKYAKMYDRKAILTDFNERCIGYINENL